MTSPFFLGLYASVLAMVYFFLMTINPNLPPSLIFSLIIGYFVYYMYGGVVKIPLPKISDNKEIKN